MTLLSFVVNSTRFCTGVDIQKQRPFHSQLIQQNRELRNNVEQLQKQLQNAQQQRAKAPRDITVHIGRSASVLEEQLKARNATLQFKVARKSCVKAHSGLPLKDKRIEQLETMLTAEVEALTRMERENRSLKERVSYTDMFSTKSHYSFLDSRAVTVTCARMSSKHCQNL